MGYKKLLSKVVKVVITPVLVYINKPHKVVRYKVRSHCPRPVIIDDYRQGLKVVRLVHSSDGKEAEKQLAKKRVVKVMSTTAKVTILKRGNRFHIKLHPTKVRKTKLLFSKLFLQGDFFVDDNSYWSFVYKTKETPFYLLVLAVTDNKRSIVLRNSKHFISIGSSVKKK